MGFGTLFVGYILLFNPFSWYTDLFACLLMALGLTKLVPYEQSFRRALIADLFAAIPAAVSFAFTLLSMFGSSLGDFYMTNVNPALRAVTFLYFTLELLIAIDRIAVATDIGALRLPAMRNRIFTAIYYALYAFANLSFDTGSLIGRIVIYSTLPVLLVGLAVHFLNAKLIFSCYMWICPEGDEDMERGESRIGFINRIQKKTDALEEEFARRRGEEENAKLRARIEKQRRKRK